MTAYEFMKGHQGMTDVFLSNFLDFAHNITGAERGFVVNAELEVVGMIALSEATFQEESFQSIATQVVSKALSQQEIVITNNTITDPSDAPITNTNFRDLRIIVAFPIGKAGVIYLDQYLRRGIITSTLLERLKAFASQCLTEDKLNLTTEELRQAYES